EYLYGVATPSLLLVHLGPHPRQRPYIVLRVATGPDRGPGCPAIRTPPDPRPDCADTYGKVLTHTNASPKSYCHLGIMTSPKLVGPKEGAISDENDYRSVSEHRQGVPCPT